MCDTNTGCQRPENLDGEPADCSPEQIRECHGEDLAHPCSGASECENSDELDTVPEECSAEQVRKCHGDAEGHPCE